MSSGQFTESADGFGTLRQFARRERPLERCELCSVGLRPDHPHLIEVAQRKLLCTCDACAILFSGQGVKFKRVPRRVRSLPGFNLSDSEWNGLMVPINMAFFFRRSLENRVIALYPSPAGATESLLALVLFEDQIPVRDTVRGACELLGLDPLHIANEGQFLAVVSPEYADAALNALSLAPGGGEAQVIGEVREQPAGTVLVTTLYGGSRIVDMLVGDPLPRIC